ESDAGRYQRRGGERARPADPPAAVLDGPVAGLAGRSERAPPVLRQATLTTEKAGRGPPFSLPRRGDGARRLRNRGARHLVSGANALVTVVAHSQTHTSGWRHVAQGRTQAQ